MRVERIPTLSDNYTYLVIDERTGEAAVIDAPEAAPVVARVDALGVRVTQVLSTQVIKLSQGSPMTGSGSHTSAMQMNSGTQFSSASHSPPGGAATMQVSVRSLQRKPGLQG